MKTKERELEIEQLKNSALRENQEHQRQMEKAKFKEFPTVDKNNLYFWHFCAAIHIAKTVLPDQQSKSRL